MAGQSPDGSDRGGTFLHRWSRRKHEAARGIEAPPPQAPVEAASKSAAVPTSEPAPGPALRPAAVAAPTPGSAQAIEPQPLPPVESLTIESDFTPFLSKKVDETVKRAALRKLFSDPHFNVMDGLDVYIDDYSKPDPVPPGFLDKLADVYKTVEEKVAQAPELAADANADAAIATHAATSPPVDDGPNDPPVAEAEPPSPTDEHRG